MRRYYLCGPNGCTEVTKEQFEFLEKHYRELFGEPTETIEEEA